MAQDMDMDMELEVVRRLEFHGVAYVATVSVAHQQLHIQVEVDDAALSLSAPASPSPLHSPRTPTAMTSTSSAAASTPEWACWTGSFPSTYIEELTRKTGNYKRFSIFVNMLLSAMAHRSDAVFVDLLTTSDLELYRKRKMGKASQPPRAPDALESFPSATPSSAAAATRRYLILTYAVEFDRVHYPLPLNRVQTPTPEILQRTIRRLRQSLAAATKSSESGHARDELAALREENRCLKSALAQRVGSDENGDWSNRPSSGAESPIDLQRELKATLRENKELIAIYQQLRESSATEIRRLQTEVQHLRDTQAQDPSQALTSDLAVERLEQQLALERSESRRKLHDSGAIVEETLAQLKRMKTQCDDLQLKNRELLRQLAIARARAGASTTHQVSPAATREPRPLGSARVNRISGAPARAHATAGSVRQRSARSMHFKPQQHHGRDSDDEDATHGSDYDSNGPMRRPPQRPFRRFDPTAYQQERQRKLLRAGRSPSPGAGRTAATAARRSSYTGGYTSDSSTGGYSSAASNDSNGSSRRGRPRTRVSAQHQRAVVDRLASPKRVADPDAYGAAAPRPTPRPSSALLGDTTADSFSDIDDRLNALQQFLKQAKQGGSGSAAAPASGTPAVRAGV